MITSSYRVGPPQVDGGSYVTETHIDNDGTTYSYEWLNDGTLNAQLVLEERALLIETLLAQRAAARAAVVGSEVPLTRHDFKMRFTAAERIAIRALAKTDPIVEDFLDLLNTSGMVYRVLAQPGLNYCASKGALTAERAVTIGGD